MACDDPRCTDDGPGDFYCRGAMGDPMGGCGEMTHAGCTCSCSRTWATCPRCGHHFLIAEEQ